jgi:hypothetical protein
MTGTSRSFARQAGSSRRPRLVRPVPFRPVRAAAEYVGDAFVESRGVLAREWRLIACAIFAFGFLPIPVVIAVGVVSRQQIPLVIATGGIALVVSMVFFWYGERQSRTVRFLRHDDQAGTIEVLRRGPDGLIERESAAEAGECRLVVRPVRLSVGVRGFWWEGWVVEVVVGDARFALSCSRGREEADQLIRELPAWVSRLPAGESERLAARGSLRMGRDRG